MNWIKWKCQARVKWRERWRLGVLQMLGLWLERRDAFGSTWVISPRRGAEVKGLGDSLGICPFNFSVLTQKPGQNQYVWVSGWVILVCATSVRVISIRADSCLIRSGRSAHENARKQSGCCTRVPRFIQLWPSATEPQRGVSVVHRAERYWINWISRFFFNILMSIDDLLVSSWVTWHSNAAHVGRRFRCYTDLC